GAQDLRAFEPRFVRPLSVSFHGATLHVPPPPCGGGALLAFGLRLFGAACAPNPDQVELARCFAEVMAATERARTEGFDEQLLQDGAVEALLDPSYVEQHAAEVRRRLGRGDDSQPGPPTGRVPGNTTHISTVDAQGNAVAFTSSNGETCGTLWPGTEIPLNNFLGEDDIHPLGFHRGPPGAPFRTMMTPALLVDADGGVMALGTGGSNRIRTAMLQVVRHIVDGGMSVQDAVMAPRIHVEADGVQLEDAGQGEAAISAAASSGRKLARFEGRHLYFGGVHSARITGEGEFEAVGDPRRSGNGQVAWAS
ncbi:MAG: gamma-glutamyltransferase, partial [Myxococcota bacterium]|nr:gamma-glutamyltransferase [Myxococcota bacterium]